MAGFHASQCALEIPDGGGVAGAVRDLEGALARVEACHQLLEGAESKAGRTVSGAAIRMALTSTVPQPSSGRPVQADEVLAEVCRALSVSRADVLGASRHKRIVLARSVCVHLCRKLTTLSYPEIARAMSRPNHSTVITADKRVRSQIARGETITLEDRVLDLEVFVNDAASRISAGRVRLR
jgi:chromosomal replication initiator protein